MSNLLRGDVFLPFKSFDGIRIFYDEFCVYQIQIMKDVEHKSSLTSKKIPGHVLSVCQWFEAYSLGCSTKPQVESCRFQWHCSLFALSVLTSLLEVPYGNVMTYGELAKISGHDGAARAVGHVMASNPFPIIVPCHRIISRSRPWLYAFGEDVKRELLLHEHVCISQTNHMIESR